MDFLSTRSTINWLKTTD